MNHKHLTLAADFLSQCSDELSNNGCNDWYYPENWTEEEKITFCREYYEWNGDADDFDCSDLTLPDFAVAAFLAHKFKKFAEIQENNHKFCNLPHYQGLTTTLN
jgi:hypothetical protein